MSLVPHPDDPSRTSEANREERPDILLIATDGERVGPLANSFLANNSSDPCVKTIVYANVVTAHSVHEWYRTGVETILARDTTTNDLLAAIRMVHRGTRVISNAVAQLLVEQVGNDALTRRELDVLSKLAEGLRNRDVARELGISEETVKAHVRNIMGKLGVRDRTSAVTAALRRGLICLE